MYDGLRRYFVAGYWSRVAYRIVNHKSLCLVRKHKFLYYFDYGDGNEFEVEVLDIRPRAEPGTYPRVVDSKGDAPAQYYWPEEER